jgi:lipoprotein-releasing system permease protein
MGRTEGGGRSKAEWALKRWTNSAAFRLSLPPSLQLTLRLLVRPEQLVSGLMVRSIIGLAIGVGCLTAAMGLFSGFERTLKTSIIELVGDIMVIRRPPLRSSAGDMVARMKAVSPEIVAATPVVNLEAVMVGQGRSSGVRIQGLDPVSLEKVLNLSPRVVSGRFDLGKGEDDGEAAPAVLGKRLAEKFALEPGAEFVAVLPVPSQTDGTRFEPRPQRFRLVGTIDLGKVEYNERALLTHLRVAQRLAGYGEAVSGWSLRLADSDSAEAVGQRLSAALGQELFLMTWFEVNSNHFNAIKFERVMIFFVVFVIVIAAAFNVATQLFVSVLARVKDLSILRAMGLRAQQARQIFVWQGVILGLIGTFAGYIFGFLLLVAFEVAQRYVVLMPPETYLLDRVHAQIRLVDLAAIGVMTVLICFLATLIPARRAASLNPVEGLMYE